MEAYEALLQKAQQEGLIKHIGLSEVSIADIKKAREYVDIVSIQNKYSIVCEPFDHRFHECLLCMKWSC